MKLPPLSVIFFGSFLFLTACTGGFDDSFFQVDNTAAGAVCIEGMSASATSNEAKDIVRRLRQYYGATESSIVNIHSAKGYQATCALYQGKPNADVTIDEAYYNTVVVPSTRN